VNLALEGSTIFARGRDALVKHVQKEDRFLYVGSSTNHTSGKGNAEWQAAESIPIEGEDQQVVYKRKSDIQVAGMLSFYVLTKGHHPFGDISYERPNNIYHGRPGKTQYSTFHFGMSSRICSFKGRNLGANIISFVFFSTLKTSYI
jgi:hypothetical protein